MPRQHDADESGSATQGHDSTAQEPKETEPEAQPRPKVLGVQREIPIRLLDTPHEELPEELKDVDVVDNKQGCHIVRLTHSQVFVAFTKMKRIEPFYPKCRAATVKWLEAHGIKRGERRGIVVDKSKLHSE